MKPTTINRWLLPLIVVMCIALGAGSAWAQAPSWTFAGTGLRQVGPLNFFGYPSFITDANNTSLEPCLVSPVDPTAPVADPCALTGTLQLGDAQPIVFVSNFPQEFFYSNASVVLDVGGVKNSITYLTALEGGFTAGFPLTPNQQVVFIRTRFRVDGGLIAGASYRVTHPYGTIDFVAEAGGKLKQITTDIGCLTAPCGSFNQLTTAVGPDGHATIGPFLQAVNPPPPAGYVGDPNILQSVTGSPTENNFFRLERIDPVAGAVLVVETDQFSLWGKLFTGTQPPPQLSIDRTTYARNASATTVNVFAFAAGAASVTATVNGTTFDLAGDGTGRYFGQAPVTGAAPGMQVNVTATNAAGSASLSSTLVDDVIVDSATYNAGTLTVQAHSTDATAAPTLTVSDLRTPPLTLGTVASGAIFTLSTPAPPAFVTVKSSLGGSDDRTVDLTPGGSQIHTTLGLVSNLNPSEFGQPVTFTATITAAGTPTAGTITFNDGAIVLGSKTVTSATKVYALTTTAQQLAIGPHSITATYSGDAAFSGSTSSPVVQVVNKASVTVTLNGQPSTSALGDSVTFSANVTVVTAAAGTPTGTVSFSDGGTTLGTAPVNGGLATFSTSTLAVGSHLITASYSGDATFKAGASPLLNFTVKTGTATTTVTATPNPTTRRQLVTLTATVGPSPASQGGTVTFTSTASNGQVTMLGTGTVDATGVAKLTFTTPNQRGTFTITASYGGNANLAPGTPGTTTLTIQ